MVCHYCNPRLKTERHCLFGVMGWYGMVPMVGVVMVWCAWRYMYMDCMEWYGMVVRTIPPPYDSSGNFFHHHLWGAV